MLVRAELSAKWEVPDLLMSEIEFSKHESFAVYHQRDQACSYQLIIDEGALIHMHIDSI